MSSDIAPGDRTPATAGNVVADNRALRSDGHGLVFSVSGPPRAARGVGAIIWGFGTAEIRLARLFGREGIPVLQARRGDGVTTDSVADAMGILGSEREATSFILVGNCAFANISLHTALQDARVTGLILTNVRVPTARLFRASLAQKLRQPGAWKRLLLGKVDVRTHLMGLAGLRTRRNVRALARRRAATEKRRTDIDLPHSLHDSLRTLSARGTKTFLVSATGDRSARYLGMKFGKKLERFDENVKFERLETRAHILSNDDDAVAAVSEAVARWIRSAGFAAPKS